MIGDKIYRRAERGESGLQDSQHFVFFFEDIDSTVCLEHILYVLSVCCRQFLTPVINSLCTTAFWQCVIRCSPYRIINALRIELLEGFGPRF